MPDQKLKEEIDRLISSGEIQYKSDLIGCCIKYYLQFPNDNHKYCYKRDKLISNTLNKKVSTHLYNMSNKSLNKKTTINDDKLAVSDKNEYVRKLIEQLRKINKGELDETKIDFTKITIKQSLKLILQNIDKHKLAIISDSGQ